MKHLQLVILLCIVGFTSTAQRITYSQPIKNEAQSIDFEVIGKMEGNFLVYKHNRDAHYISVYADDMKPVDRIKLDFIPAKVLRTDILSCKNYFYVFFQYQTKNIVYCKAVKLDAAAKLVGGIVDIDTTIIDYTSNKKIYTILNSEDKQKIVTMKINAKEDKQSIVATILLDTGLQLLHRTTVQIPLKNKNNFLTEFSVDNDGDIAFLRATTSTSQSGSIESLNLLVKPALEDSIYITDVDLKQSVLNDVRLKVDNVNKHYLVTSFYSKSRKGNVEGLYNFLWNKTTRSTVQAKNTIFSEALRDAAGGDRGVKTAFNDFFLQNIVMRSDGGFLLASECVFANTRDAFGNGMYGLPYYSPIGSYYLDPYMYPWSRMGGGMDRAYGGQPQTLRYAATNIAVFSFDISGKMEWANVIEKAQYDDNTDNYLGYATMTTKGEIHFVFNQMDRKIFLLSDYSINTEGKLKQNLIPKNLDKGFTFMPRFAKQVSSWQMLIPCEYKGVICFAKLEF